MLHQVSRLPVCVLGRGCPLCLWAHDEIPSLGCRWGHPQQKPTKNPILAMLPSLSRVLLPLPFTSTGAWLSTAQLTQVPPIHTLQDEEWYQMVLEPRVLLTKLQPDTTYIVRVRTLTPLGPGPFSPDHEFRTSPPPGGFPLVLPNSLVPQNHFSS